MRSAVVRFIWFVGALAAASGTFHHTHSIAEFFGVLGVALMVLALIVTIEGKQ